MCPMGSWEWEKSGENQAFKMFPLLQVFTFCGPEKESCVSKQTLKDKSCLIPCTGLYADIADDSLKQNTQAFEHHVIEGSVNVFVTPWPTYIRFQPANSRAHTAILDTKWYWTQSTKSKKTPTCCPSTAVPHLSRRESRWSEVINGEIPQIQKGIRQASRLQPWQKKPQ